MTYPQAQHFKRLCHEHGAGPQERAECDCQSLEVCATEGCMAAKPTWEKVAFGMRNVPSIERAPDFSQMKGCSELGPMPSDFGESAKPANDAMLDAMIVAGREVERLREERYRARWWLRVAVALNVAAATVNLWGILGG